MHFLRRFVRLWFGIQTLGFLISALSVCVLLVERHRAQSAAGDPLVLSPTIAATLLLAIFDGTSAIAWWTLRSGRRYARDWAIAASVLNLPFPLLDHLRNSSVMAHFMHFPEALIGSMIGVGGLIAYWPNKAEAPSPAIPAKSPRIAGDGTSKFKDYAAQGLSMAIIWLSCATWGRWAAAHQLQYPGFLAFILQMQTAVLLTAFGHEVGHLVAGWASGTVLRAFRVGPFRWSIRGGVWKFDFNMRKFYGSSVEMVAPDLVNMESRKAFSLMGGPAASLAMGSIFMAATLATPASSWQSCWLFFSMLATFSMAAFLVNLIPLKPESSYSDGAQLYQVITNGPWAQVHFAFAMVNTSLVSEVRPRDFTFNVLHQAAASVPQGDRGALLRLYTCLYYLDCNQISEAIDSLEDAELLYEQSAFERPQDICSQFLFVNAFFKRDLDAAEYWASRVAALRKSEADADYWRGQCALYWLRGDRENARAAWECGYPLALKLPSAGAYDFTRASFSKLRAALELSIRTDQTSLEPMSAMTNLVAIEA